VSGKVPPGDMPQDRIKLLDKAKEAFTNGNFSKSGMVSIIESLYYAAIECPRMSCTYCEHIARSEAQRQSQVGEAEAG
jgi:hypothetical protein